MSNTESNNNFPTTQLFGYDALKSGATNKSTAFSQGERHGLNLRGLLPHKISDQNSQVICVLENMRRMKYVIEK